MKFQSKYLHYPMIFLSYHERWNFRGGVKKKKRAVKSSIPHVDARASRADIESIEQKTEFDDILRLQSKWLLM